MLREAAEDCPLSASWMAEHLAACMPEQACACFRYLLTDPQPPLAMVAGIGLWTLVAANCPEALPLAEASLHYRTDAAAQTEAVQTAAWQALLGLGDPAAIPILRAYLADGRASRGARDQLVEALQVERGHPWRAEILQVHGVPG